MTREKIDIKKLKFDDNVFCIENGIGKVANVNSENKFSITVDFESGIANVKYTSKGFKNLKHKAPSLFIAEVSDLTKISWDNIYTLPIRYDNMSYAWSANDNMALTFDDDVTKDKANSIVNKINNVNHQYNIDNLRLENDEFYEGDEYLFCVRGFGYLTGFLRLELSEAVRIQNEFAQYIYNQLTTKAKTYYDTTS